MPRAAARTLHDEIHAARPIFAWPSCRMMVALGNTLSVNRHRVSERYAHKCIVDSAVNKFTSMTPLDNGSLSCDGRDCVKATKR